MHLFEHQL